VTLCRGDEVGIHYGYGDYRRNEDGSCYFRDDWYEKCPRCGREPASEELDAGPVAVELGFAGPRKERPTGVRGCSSFTWAQEPLSVRERCLRLSNRWRKIVVDGYGQKYTGKQFIKMLDTNCPVQYTRHVGVEFD